MDFFVCEAVLVVGGYVGLVGRSSRFVVLLACKEEKKEEVSSKVTFSRV